MKGCDSARMPLYSGRYFALVEDIFFEPKRIESNRIKSSKGGRKTELNARCKYLDDYRDHCTTDSVTPGCAVAPATLKISGDQMGLPQKKWKRISP